MSRLTNIALRRLEKALGPTGVEPERSQNEETPGEPENAQMLVAIGVDESPESSESDDWLAQFPSEGRDEPAAVESAMPPPTAASYPVADTDLDRFKSEDKSESAATEHAIADEKEYALRGRSTIFTETLSTLHETPAVAEEGQTDRHWIKTVITVTAVGALVGAVIGVIGSIGFLGVRIPSSWFTRALQTLDAPKSPAPAAASDAAIDDRASRPSEGVDLGSPANRGNPDNAGSSGGNAGTSGNVAADAPVQREVPQQPPVVQAPVIPRPQVATQPPVVRQSPVITPPPVRGESAPVTRTPEASATPRQAPPVPAPEVPGASLATLLPSGPLPVPPPSSLAPPRRTPAPPVPAAEATPPAEASRTASETSAIYLVLGRYQSGFNDLNATVAKSVWPSVDEKMLARAFDRLDQQEIVFDACQIDVNGTRATVSCRGRARYVPKVGNKATRFEPRHWNFRLQNTGNNWVIDGVEFR